MDDRGHDSIIGVVGAVLSAPRDVVNAGASAEARARLVPQLLAIVAVGAAIYGGVIGAWTGGIQTIYAALKMPLLLLIPIAVGLPAVRVMFSTVDEDVGWDRLTLAGLVAAARTAILAAAAGPVLWLVWSVTWSYHDATLILALSLAAVGLPGLAAIRHALPRVGPTSWPAIAASVLVIGLATMQTGWVLRPFVARPGAEVALLRPMEADIMRSLWATGRSSVGDYGHFDAEPSGLVGRGLRQESDR